MWKRDCNIRFRWVAAADTQVKVASVFANSEWVFLRFRRLGRLQLLCRLAVSFCFPEFFAVKISSGPCSTFVCGAALAELMAPLAHV